MYILQQCKDNTIQYLKYDGWAVFPMQGPLDLNNCIFFTTNEVALNPPANGQTYQKWGCFAPIGREK